MKLALLLFLAGWALPVTWLGDFGEATKQAQAAHKYILVNFSGSDWCGPCIRLRKEILESSVFTDFAGDHLVLVRADFPRQKKNKLPAAQVKLNEALADRYNRDGHFPYTLLLTDQGKVVKSWDGYPDETPEQFVNDIKNASR